MRCPTGFRLQKNWYDQVERGEKPEWTELAHQDYSNHIRACPVCSQWAEWQGNPIPVSFPTRIDEKVEVINV